VSAPVVTIENVTVTLTPDQIIAAIRQLDPAQREWIRLQLTSEDRPEDDAFISAVQALNSPVARAVWDNPSDAAVYDDIVWRPGPGDDET